MGLRQLCRDICILIVRVVVPPLLLCYLLMILNFLVSHFKGHVENAAYMEVIGLAVKTEGIRSPLIRNVKAAERVLKKRTACLNCSLLVTLYNQDLRRQYRSIQSQDPNNGICLIKYHDLAAGHIIGNAQCVTCDAYYPLEPCKSCGTAMACTDRSRQCLRASLDPNMGRLEAMKKHGACPGQEQYSS